jgi:hypothetical protein
MADARFEDGAPERPLRLLAETPEDLAVIAALTQDAVGRVGEAAFLPRRRRFAAVLNRFRWEDAEAAARAGRPYERVRATLVIENAMAVKARGVNPADRDAVFSLLDIAFEPAEDGAGLLRLTLSGGADIAVTVEALDITLTDMARPHAARGLPGHED